MQPETIKSDSTSTTTKKPKGTGLKYVPAGVNLIPRYLIEQIKGIDFDIDKFYQLAPVIEKNPFNFIGLFIDKGNKVQGFMWSTYNPLSDHLFVNMLSVEKEYQRLGIIKECIGICKKILKGIGSCGNISAKTTRPKAFSKYGFKESKQVIVDYEG